MKNTFTKCASFVMAALAVASLGGTLSAEAKLNVVATLPDFAAIAREVGGDRIAVVNLAKGAEDPHFVDAKPSFITVLNKADLLIEGGAELEIGWLPPLVNNARNGKILPGAPGRLNAAAGIRLLDVPTAAVDRSQGDVHPLGNPHYWLDPVNASVLADSIAGALARLDAPNGGFYSANARRFRERVDQKLGEWSKMMEPYRGTKVLTYHKSFDYLLARFGLELAGTVEPKPGLEPSPTHINSLIPRAKREGVKLVLIEPFRSRKTPEYVARRVGAKLLVLPDKVGGHEKVKDVFALFDYDVSQIVAALKP